MALANGNSKEKIQGGNNKAAQENIQLENEAQEQENIENSIKVEKKEAKLELKQEKIDRKEELKQIREEVKMTYSEEELESITKVSKEMEKQNKNLKVLPVDSIVRGKAKGHFKFDTPPVVKEGRTLIPVRAITEGLGATVEWNGETKEVTIVKGDITIVIQLDSNVVTVNGEEVEIDVPAQAFSNRTYVPLRFIAETLGLKVSWDEETETIEISDEDEDAIDEEAEEEDAEEDEEVAEEEETEEESEEDTEVEEEETNEETNEESNEDETEEE